MTVKPCSHRPRRTLVDSCVKWKYVKFWHQVKVLNVFLAAADGASVCIGYAAALKWEQSKACDSDLARPSWEQLLSLVLCANFHLPGSATLSEAAYWILGLFMFVELSVVLGEQWRKKAFFPPFRCSEQHETNPRTEHVSTSVWPSPHRWALA